MRRGRRVGVGAGLEPERAEGGHVPVVNQHVRSCPGRPGDDRPACVCACARVVVDRRVRRSICRACSRGQLRGKEPGIKAGGWRVSGFLLITDERLFQGWWGRVLFRCQGGVGVNGLLDTGWGGVWATRYLISGMRILSLAVPVMWSVTRAAASHQDSHNHVSKPGIVFVLA